MAVSIKQTSDVAAVITVQVSAADYQPQVDKALKNYQKNASIPGFRKGHAPLGLIKKQVGTSVKVEEINRAVVSALFGYIDEEKLQILGNPLPVATKEMEDEQIKRMLENAGKQIEADTVEDNDVVYGRALELADGQPKEGGIEAAQALILPRFTKSEAEKAKLIGAKLGDTITFEPFALYDGQASEIASLLQIEKEAVPALDGVAFSYQITKISRREPAELNDAFFTEAFGEGSDIRSEEALRKNIQESFAEQFATESDFKFTRDLRALLLKKAGKVAYDEALLKRIFLARNAEAKVEDLDRDMPQILDDITFDRIKGQLLEAAGVQISDEDLNKFALIMLKDGRTKENLIDRVADSKLAAIAKEAITVTEKEVSPEDFNKLMSEDTKA